MVQVDQDQILPALRQGVIEDERSCLSREWVRQSLGTERLGIGEDG